MESILSESDTQSSLMNYVEPTTRTIGSVTDVDESDSSSQLVTGPSVSQKPSNEDSNNGSSGQSPGPTSPTPAVSAWRTNFNRDLFSQGNSSSDDDDYGDPEEESCSLEEIKLKAKKKFKLANSDSKPEKATRKSSKASAPRTTKDEMKQIRSESQRMVRESAVSLPYHKPKQRSLTEFLNRKRVAPIEGNLLKPRVKDLDVVVQVLEDRAKEVESFFQSESDCSDDGEEAELAHSAPSTSKSEVVRQDSALLNDATEEDEEKEKASPVKEDSSDSMQTQPAIRVGENLSVDDPRKDTLEPIAVPTPSNTANRNASDGHGEVSQGNDDAAEISSAFGHKEKLESLKRLSMSKVGKPTLHGKPGELLDLGEGDASASPHHKKKVNDLIERYVQQVTKTKKSPQKKQVQISIVQKVLGSDGQLELKSEIVNVNLGNETDGVTSALARRKLLKESLRNSMSAKRAADRLKRMQAEKDDNEELETGDKSESEIEEDILSDDEFTDMEEEEEDTRALRKKKKKKNKKVFLEEEADDSENDGGDEDVDGLQLENDEGETSEADDESSDADNWDSRSERSKRTECNSQPEWQRVETSCTTNLKDMEHFSSFEDLTPNLGERDSPEEMSHISKLESTQPNAESNLDELLALCSGKFAEEKTQPSTSRSLFGKEDSENDEPEAFSRIVPMSDDDDDYDIGGPTKLTLVDDEDLPPNGTLLSDDDEHDASKKKKKNGRRNHRLYISDDEEELSQISDGEEEEEMHEEEREFRELTDFFEKEAELSGSEIGSGDEREDGEDYWEEEEGDKEEFDENEIREQVGRAHIKTLIDQDQRDVRILQELYLEDGDLHSDGGGRQRQFRWKDANMDDEDGNRMDGNSQEEDDAAAVEDQDDSAWRKMRNEREKWFQQQKAKESEDLDMPIGMKRSVKTIQVNSAPKSKPIAGNSSHAAPCAPPLSSPPKRNVPNTMVKRGSFLRRSEKDLSTIASLTKAVLPVQAPKAGANFVFASLTPERAAASENRKHKQEESKGESPNRKQPPAKKAKTSSAKSIFSYF